MMNRRFRASELGLQDVARNLAPFRPHVRQVPPEVLADETLAPGAEDQAALLPAAAPGGDLADDRAHLLSALFVYLWAITGDQSKATTAYFRIASTIDAHVHHLASRQAQQDD